MRAQLKRILLGKPIDPLIEWPRLLAGRVTISSGTNLSGSTLAVHDPTGCSLSIGSDSNVEGSLVFEKSDSEIRIGSRTHVGGGTVIGAAQFIEIGDDVLIAFDSLITDHNSHSLKFAERRNDVREWIEGCKDWSRVSMAPVKIDNKSWIGARVIILKGVNIGEGAVVGAGSVVTQDVPAWTIAAGNPARVIRALTDEERKVE